jgi:hypothetical protein
MCRMCVDEGRMTQADLDAANAEQTDQADGAAWRLLGDGDAAEFLTSLLSLSATEPDPEVMAQEALDSAVKIMLDFIAQEDRIHGIPDDVVDLADACERDAGKMMYRCQPKTLALTLTILARRYVILLDQWATLYAKAAIGDDDTIDLDAATTAEAKLAVTRATANSEHETGMYL